MASKRTHIIELVIVLVAVLVSDARGQDALPTITPVGSGVVTVEAGKVGTGLFRLHNPTKEALRVQLILDMPTGWSPLLPPPAVTVAPESAINQLITFRVPGRAPAGDYVLGATVDESGEWLQKRSTIDVTVLPRFGIEIEVLDKPTIVAAGDAYGVLYRLSNTGNTDIALSLTATSSMRYPVSLPETSASMAPGETHQVLVEVETSDRLTNRLIHQTRLRVESPDLVEAVTGTAGVDLVPRSANLVPESRTGIPILISANGYSEGGATGRQFEAEIRATRIGDKTVDLLIRAPDIRATSSYSQRDTYSLGVDAPDWELKLGDHSYPLTDLTETGRAGFGGAFRRAFGRVQVGGHAHTSRHVFPKEKQFAGFANVSLSRHLEAGVSYLGRREFEEGDIISMTTRIIPRIGTTLDAEYARGRFGGNTDDAISVSLVSQSKRLSVSARYVSAGEYFLGAVKNLNSGSVSANLAPADWFRIQGQYRLNRRFFFVDEDMGRIAQDNIYYRAGTGITNSFSGKRLWIMSFLRGRIQNNPLFGFRRQERAVEVVAGFNVRRFGFTTQYHTGKAEDPAIEEESTFWKIGLTLFGSVRRLSFSASSEFTSGPTFFNPVPQERLTAGITISVEPLEGLNASVNTFFSRDRLFSDQTFRLVDTRIDYRFPFGHELSLQGRVASTGADQDIRSSTIGISYRVPLSLNVFSVSTAEVFSGRIYDMESGLGVADAVVSLGRTTVLTDTHGQFRLPRPGKGTEYLSVDRQSIGLDRVTTQEMPLPIIADDPTLMSLEIGVIRSSLVRAEVTHNPSDGAGRTSALADALSAGGQTGIVVELTDGNRRLRRITDHNGRVAFPDLVPGEWKMFVVERTVPEGYRADPDTVRFSVSPAGEHDILFSIKTRQRAIRILSTGAPSLARGGAPLQLNPTVLPTEFDKEKDAPEERKAGATSPDSTEAAGAPDQTVRQAEEEPVHVVQSGETLASLARQYYGRTILWIRIWIRNQEQLPDPDKVRPGTTLYIPPVGPLTGSEIQTLLEHEK